MNNNIFLRLRPIHRFIISLIFAAAAWFIVGNSGIGKLMNFMICWDVFALIYVLNCWIIILTLPVSLIEKQAGREDGSRFFVSMVITLATIASMIIIFLLITRKSDESPRLVYALSVIAGMIFSWLLLNTTFGLHYAHLFYSREEDPAKPNIHGLTFPGEKKPDYLDFIYFSFVIGMTFQVSDVQVHSRRIRRVVLMHSLLAFFVNTFAIALAINLIAGLRNT